MLVQKKILVVDDEPDICNSLRKYFRDKGYVVFTCCEAGAALDLLNKEKPDVLILDIFMPGLNGIEVLRIAKEINKDVKVIMLTAIKDEFIVKEALNLGASFYMTKPFNLDALEKVVSGGKGSVE